MADTRSTHSRSQSNLKFRLDIEEVRTKNMSIDIETKMLSNQKRSLSARSLIKERRFDAIMNWSENKDQCELRKEKSEYGRMFKLAMAEKNNDKKQKTFEKKQKDTLMEIAVNKNKKKGRFNESQEKEEF